MTAAMGVGENQLAIKILIIISVTCQALEPVDTTLRTVYARISDIRVDIEEDGVTLGNYYAKMAELGFNVLDTESNLYDIWECMKGIGSHWQDLTSEQQTNFSYTKKGWSKTVF